MDVNIDSVRTVDLTIEKRPQVSRMEIVDSGRRRRFSKEAKLAIVAESYSAPRQVALLQRLAAVTGRLSPVSTNGTDLRL